MAIIKKTAFNGHIKWLKTRGEDFEQRIRESMAFIAYCGLKDGNSTPATQWEEAGLPKWLAAMGASAAQRKWRKATPEECAEKAEQIAAELVERTLLAEQAKRERAKARRDAKAQLNKENAEVAAKAPDVGEGIASEQPAPPKASTDKPDAAEPRKAERVEHYTLGHFNRPSGADEVMHLTKEEYAAAVEAVAAMRKPAEPRKAS